MGRLSRHAPETAPRGEALPATPLAARAHRPGGVDDHVADLSPEARRAAHDVAARDHPPADPGAEGHHHRVADPGGGTEGPLRHGGAGGVVVDDGPGPPEAGRKPAGDVEPTATGKVGRVAQHAGVVDEARGSHADRRHLRLDAVAQLLGHRRERFDNELEAFGVVGRDRGAARAGVAAARGGDTHLGQHDTFVVDGHTEHFGAAHVDPDRHLPRHADLLPRCPATGDRRRTGAHVVSEDSTRALSSSRAVCMMRLWARRLMNPGSGTRSSTSRV